MIPFDHEHQFMQRANELFVRINGCMRQRCYHRECCCFIGDCLTLIRSHFDICVDLFWMGLKSDGLRPFATPSNPSTRKPVFAANTAFCLWHAPGNTGSEPKPKPNQPLLSAQPPPWRCTPWLDTTYTWLWHQSVMASSSKYLSNGQAPECNLLNDIQVTFEVDRLFLFK